ncbi:MAG: DUF4276 family protein [Limisphaerales bacterium]
MIPIPINLAVEDEMSEWVVRRILLSRPVTYAIGPVFGHQGCGYLRKKAAAFQNAARACPFLLLTDLDQYPCPSALIEEWLDRPRHPRFLLRVAVREVESWLLGDAPGVRAFLGLRKTAAPCEPEQLTDPKQELLKLVLSSPRRPIREALAWKDELSGRLCQGPDYNATLARFVALDWNLVGARKACPSLNRLFAALKRIESDFVAGRP